MVLAMKNYHKNHRFTEKIIISNFQSGQTRHTMKSRNEISVKLRKIKESDSRRESNKIQREKQQGKTRFILLILRFCLNCQTPSLLNSN